MVISFVEMKTLEGRKFGFLNTVKNKFLSFSEKHTFNSYEDFKNRYTPKCGYTFDRLDALISSEWRDVPALDVLKLDSFKYFKKGLPSVDSTIGVIYLGLLSYPDKQDDTHKFLVKCKEMTESDHFQGILAHPMKMELVPLDENGIVRNKDGTLARLGPQEVDKNDVVDPSKLIHRCMFLFYFKSKLTREEANERYGNLFQREGDLPSEW